MTIERLLRSTNSNVDFLPMFLLEVVDHDAPFFLVAPRV